MWSFAVVHMHSIFPAIHPGPAYYSVFLGRYPEMTYSLAEVISVANDYREIDAIWHLLQPMSISSNVELRSSAWGAIALSELV